MHRDLVQWQLHVAGGHPLPAKQNELKCTGHSIEARIYAEDPQNDFLPMTGTLAHLQTPAVQHDCRVESAVRQGDEVSIFYDPMIAKLIVSAPDRDAALRRMKEALDEYRIVGPPTNIEFLKRCVQHPAFVKGRVETGFIPEYIADLNPPAIVATPALNFTAAAVFSQLLAESDAAAESVEAEDEESPWASNSNFRLNMSEERSVVFGVEGDEDMRINVTVVHLGEDDYLMTFADGSSKRVTGFEDGDGENEADEGLLQMTVGDMTYKARVLEDEDQLHVYIDGNCTTFTLPTVEYGEMAGKGGDGCVAPMAGKVVKVMVVPGQAIVEGEALVIMEAMKMEHVIKAPRAGVVERVPFTEGDFVEGGKNVVTFVKKEEEE